MTLQAFNDAYMLVEPMEKPGEVIAPYVVKNDTGLFIKLKLDETFKVTHPSLCCPSLLPLV